MKMFRIVSVINRRPQQQPMKDRKKIPTIEKEVPMLSPSAGEKPETNSKGNFCPKGARNSQKVS